MKILYLCTSIDKYMLEQIKALRSASIEIDILDIVEYKLIYNSGKKIYIRPKSRYKALEYFFVLDEINEYFRRREIFDYLDEYDIVHIYKSSQYAMSLKDKIESISLKYVITPNELLLKNCSKLRELFEGCKIFFFGDESLKLKFNHYFDYKEKSVLLYNPVEYLLLYDKIESETLDKFKKLLSIDDDKKIVFCHFKGTYLKQEALLKNIIDLPKNIKKQTTFLLYFDNKDANFNKELINCIENIKLDYIVMKSNMNKEQTIMTLKLSDLSIFIDYNFTNELFLASIYAKNHVFIYNPKDIEKSFRKYGIFIDNFLRFESYFDEDEENYGIYRELYSKNRKKIYEMFHPQSYIDGFLNKILESEVIE